MKNQNPWVVRLVAGIDHVSLAPESGGWRSFRERTAG